MSTWPLAGSSARPPTPTADQPTRRAPSLTSLTIRVPPRPFFGRPDLNTEELLEKRKNLEKIKMFSRNLRVINREEETAIAARKAELAPSAASPTPLSALSKHQKAKEYARAVPKPRVRPADKGGKAGGEGADGLPVEELEGELDALALLEKQHAEHKAQAALIRAELGL